MARIRQCAQVIVLKNPTDDGQYDRYVCGQPTRDRGARCNRHRPKKGSAPRQDVREIAAVRQQGVDDG